MIVFSDFGVILAALLSMFLGCVFLFIGIRLAIFDQDLLKKSREPYRSLRDFLKGHALTSYDYISDGVIQAGLSYDAKNKRLVSNGKPSDDVIERFFEK